MTEDQIKNTLNQAVDKVIKKDEYLLINDLNERSISHKLGAYLAELCHCYMFEVHVDCEYNKNVVSDDKKKYIQILKSKLRELRLLREEEIDTDSEIIYREVYPDIVIHQRDTTNNLCIVEVKKSTNSSSRDKYDRLKLCCYTSKDNDYKLNYKLGAFVIFSNRLHTPTAVIEWYKNGEKLEEVPNIR